MRTNPNQSGEMWIVTLRTASAGSTATIFPALPDTGPRPVSFRRAAVGEHSQTVWTCSVPLSDIQVSLITSAEPALEHAR